METAIINFIFESGISLSIFTLIYLLMLRKETFFHLNRIFLLVSLAISFVLPFAHFRLMTAPTTNMIGEVTVTAPGYQNLLQTVTVYGSKFSVAFAQTIQSIGWIRLIYLTGTVIFSLLFLYRLVQIALLIIKNERVKKDGLKIVRIDKDITLFSFFNYIFINKNHAYGPGMKEMFAHESEHVRQGHSFDVLFMELATILQWFNPFIWLLKRSIRENHEFLADHGVLKPGVSPAAYKLLLLGSSLKPQPVIANNFNYSLIKIRIQMMTKIKSSRTAALKLSMGILATAALFMVFAFDGTQTSPQEKKTTGQKTEANSNANTNAQQKSSGTKDQVFMVVEEMPEFPGGEVALRTYIAGAVNYPEDAKKAGIQGKVFISFVVDKAGKVIDAKIARGASPSLDKEALRVIESMPAWKPGKQKGVNVAVQYTMPIQFALK
jgi:TonB family protein